MGVYSGNDVDTAGDAEVTLKTAAGVELLGQQTSAASLPVVIASDQAITAPTYQFDVERKRLYGLVTDTNMATVAELRLILIRNPIGSGKTLYLQRWTTLLTNTANSSGVLRAYLAPTITANGTAATIVNTAVGGGGAASAMTAFTSPTVSATGTFAYATRVQGGDGAQPTEVNFEGSISIAPGVDILITGTPDGTNRDLISSFLWLEK